MKTVPWQNFEKNVGTWISKFWVFCFVSGHQYKYSTKVPSDLFYDEIRWTKFSFSHSESEFVWEVPLRLKVLLLVLSYLSVLEYFSSTLVRVLSYVLNTTSLNKSAISFVLWWNSLNKTEQKSDFVQEISS
jgi:hypothetical protein